MVNQGNFATRCSALPVAHVDLATLTALEAYLHGGAQCSTWVMREVNKANWAAVGLTTLRNTGGKPDYGRETSWLLSRGGDYAIHSWFRVRVPLVKLKRDGCLCQDASIRYTKNFMHNLVRTGSLSVNELCISVFDTFILDLYQAFWLPANKALGYKNMIGDIPSMTSPASYDGVDDFEALGTGGYFNLPLPFFYEEDYGVALPMASLIYVDLHINLQFADFEDLIIINPGTPAAGTLADVADDLECSTPRAATCADIEVCGKAGCKPSLEEGELYTQYVIVNNDERKAMAKMKRTMVIKGWQRLQEQTWDSQTTNHYNLRFSYNLAAIFTAVRNDSTSGDGSNYTTAPHSLGVDPVAFENLQYENSSRTGDVAADLTSLVFPYFIPGMAIPDVTGLHLLIAYSLDITGSDPAYGVNAGKINQIILNSFPSEAGRLAGLGKDHFGETLHIATKEVHEDDDPKFIHYQTFTKLVAAHHLSVINVGSGTVTVPVL